MILNCQIGFVVVGFLLLHATDGYNEIFLRRKKIGRNRNKVIRSNHLTSKFPYYVDNNNTAFLPRNNYDITLGNPLRGLAPDGTTSPKVWPSNFPASLTLFKWPLSLFMLADPSIYGDDTAFNWTWIESNLNSVASFDVHAIVRFWIEWPGQPLRIPSYLLQPQYNLTLLNNGTTLNYDDPVLKNAINQSIQAFGRRYDGDRRIYALQAGFFGAWGEWHSRGVVINVNGKNVSTMPANTAEEAVPWYRAAFKKTHVQFRYPDRTIAYRLGFGYHDDSFTYETLGGTYNGNATATGWFFWNITQRFNTSHFWKYAPMGGETRPNNVAIVFTSSYESYTMNKQDFGACVKVTHTSYIAWGRGWALNNGTRGVNGTELLAARNASARMGYSFEIDSIAASESEIGPGAVDIAVTIKQSGVAPFYYSLNVSLYCNGGIRYATSPVAIWSLLEKGDTSTSNLINIPAGRSCLDAVDLRLESEYLYAGRPIRWAQGTNNGTVVLSIPPVPNGNPTSTPTSPPNIPPTTVIPANSPSIIPTGSPTLSRNANPTASPWNIPTPNPSNKPAARPSSIPTAKPNHLPTWQPTVQRPTKRPVKQPISRPKKSPIARPTLTPIRPVQRPTRRPIKVPVAKRITRTKASSTN